MTLRERTSPQKAPLGAGDLDALVTTLQRRFTERVDTPWGETDFEALALRVFEYQFRHNATYQGFCRGRGASPESVQSWREIPAVPATAFKHLDLVAGSPHGVEAVFHTSGTTRDGGARGRHLVPRLSLYRASLLPPFKAHLLPDRDRIRFVSLIPSPEEQPRSSLSHMVGMAGEAFASEVHWGVDGSGAILREALADAFRSANKSAEPVLLLGTAFAFVHALDQNELGPLPAGSRIMETGGLKGRSRELPAAELRRALSAATGVALDHIVSEYGMTELLSQLYTLVLSERDSGIELVPPPWLRVRALDPTTLEEVAEGSDGLLAFFDLANAGSVSHVLTEDVGSVTRGRVRLAGRFDGAEPRGCSRAMDELMTAAATPQ